MEEVFNQMRRAGDRLAGVCGDQGRPAPSPPATTCAGLAPDPVVAAEALQCPTLLY
jgi:hypothetical protein